MGKVEEYRRLLRELDEWDSYLLAESGLPGARGNIELAQAVAEEGERALFERYLTCTAKLAPSNTPEEFLAFCGVVGLGRLLAEGEEDLLPALRQHASDPRWRVREAVAMALQRLGDADLARLLAEMAVWSEGTPLEQRAAAAALCEPRLLGDPDTTRAVLQILDRLTSSIAGREERRGDAFRALRQGLGYCWSVAVVALPEEGKPLLEKWIAAPDADVRWIMRENLKKARLARMDAAWVAEARARLAAAGPL
jgi:hypothetical protein